MPGLAEAMRAESLQYTPMSMLSRAVAGVAGGSLIINFPGNPKAIAQLFGVVEPVLRHAVATLHRQNGKRKREKSLVVWPSGPAGPAAAGAGPGDGVLVVELDGLTRHFGERTVLRGITLSVGAGQTLAVLGRNGAGKSTLLRILK